MCQLQRLPAPYAIAASSPVQEPSVGLEAEAQALPSCRDITGRDYVITYYAEPARVTEVGQLLCGCSEPETVLSGTKTVYYEKVYGCFAK